MDRMGEKITSWSSVHSRRSRESSAFGDFGSRSEVSSFESQGAPTTEKGFMWKNQYQHAMYFISYTFSWGLFVSLRKEKSITEVNSIPTWFHILISYVFFAGPMLYLQVFIGQYTQKGCIVLGAMLPVAYGVGYSMLISTMVTCTLNLYFSSAILYYILVSMINYPTPSWMLCLPIYESEKRCFSRDDIDLCPPCSLSHSEVPCFDPDKDILSASLFKDIIVFMIGDVPAPDILIDIPRTTQTVHLLLTTIFVLILSLRSLKDLDDSIRISNIFVIVSIIIICAVILLNHPSVYFFESMFYFKLESLLNAECWKEAFISTANRLKLMDGGHILFGSYMPLTVNCTNRVTYLLMAHVSFFALSRFMTYSMEDFLACSLNLDRVTLNRYSDIESTFALYPTALGILAAAQLWATLYFLILFTLTLHSIALQIILVQETLTQVIIDRTYYIYTRIMLIAITCGLAFYFASPSGFVVASQVFQHRTGVIFILICLVYFIVFFYGLEKFSDDIHFILQSPPSRYLKFSWVLSTFVCAFVLINRFVENPYKHHPNAAIALIVFIFFPMPVGFIYQVIRAIKARELSGLMKSADDFGPENSEERASRRLFNPRYEVRFRRRRNYCKHRCLLDSVTLRRCLEKELILLNHVLLDIEENEEERTLKKDFLKALHLHRRIMSDALTSDPTKDYFRNRRADFEYT